MTFHFGELISHSARTRRLSAGTIVGSGTVSNYDATRGFSCIVEQRMQEIIEHGAAAGVEHVDGDDGAGGRRGQLYFYSSDGTSALDKTTLPYQSLMPDAVKLETASVGVGGAAAWYTMRPKVEPTRTTSASR